MFGVFVGKNSERRLANLSGLENVREGFLFRGLLDHDRRVRGLHDGDIVAFSLQDVRTVEMDKGG